ncbi:uncharacterized protein LOC135840371 [Planococcus citri]|uniref:uncharacterized protein LOC135840371 n=1 Tax=Planococcus citri TaxID=170843 RepID=UPI0031FA08F7
MEDDDKPCTLTKSELRIIFERLKEWDRKHKKNMEDWEKRMKSLQKKLNLLNELNVLDFTLNISEDKDETGIVEGQNLFENSLGKMEEEKEDSKMKKSEVGSTQADLSSVIYWPSMTKYDPGDLLDFLLNSPEDHGTGIVEGQNSLELKVKKIVVPKQTHNESLKKMEIELKEYEADLQRKHDRMKKEMEADIIELKEKQQKLEAEKIQYQKELES